MSGAVRNGPPTLLTRADRAPRGELLVTHHHLVLPDAVESGAWRAALPVLNGAQVSLRELQIADAFFLRRHVERENVLKYISHSPTSIEGFQRFITWTQKGREQGTHLCFGVIPEGAVRPVGLLQLWPIVKDFSTSEWGFVIGEEYWGTGLFMAAARLFLDFAFDTMGVSRLEARVVDVNLRGLGVLHKLGARREAVLRRGFRRDHVFMDHVMWSLNATDWAGIREATPSRGVLEPSLR